MSLTPKTQEVTRELIPAGNYVARLYSIVDLGTHVVEWKGNKMNRSKVRFTFELCNETKEFEKDGVKKTLPLVIGREYTNSMSDMGRLLPVIEGLLGKKLTEAQAADWDVERFRELLGTPCMLTVLHDTKGDKTYANLATIAPMPKGISAPQQVNENMLFEIDNYTQEQFEKLPKFMQAKIMESIEMSGGTSNEPEMTSPQADGSDGINPDDIPF